MKRRQSRRLALIAALAIVAVAAISYRAALQKMPEGKLVYIRYEKSERVGNVLSRLQNRGIIRSATALRIYAILHRHPSVVPAGTLGVHAGMTSDQVLTALEHPVVRKIRLPETNWARRSAHLLEKDSILDATDYMTLVHNPGSFQKDVHFPLPADSLEGYLYPDTYYIAPLVGARPVILKQLSAFEKKVWDHYGQPKDLQKLLTVASLVELEGGYNPDRKLIAGVIYNRLHKGMPLQIDASLLYGIQKWRKLTYADYREIDSPYNLYTHKGLPPGPICSPSERSIDAALTPAKHAYLYYVAMPNGHSLFAKTYPEHLKNIARRKAALKLLNERKQVFGLLPGETH